MNDLAESWEGQLGDAVDEAFEVDRRAILAAVDAAKTKALFRKSTVDWENLILDIKAYLSSESEPQWREKLLPLFIAIMEAQGHQMETTYGVDFSVRNLYAEKWLEDYQLQFAQPINKTTSGNISTILEQAKREGWSADTLKKRLGDVFQQWMKGDLTSEDFKWLKDRMPEYRKEIIVRTESMRASNVGNFYLMEEWGAPGKGWLTTMDGRERPTHAAVNGQKRSMGEPFNVGGAKMMHPHDMNLGAPIWEVAQCRCTVIPILDLEELNEQATAAMD